MTELIQWARLPDPATAVSQLNWPPASYMYLERIPDAWLGDINDEDGVQLGRLTTNVPFTNWERGRLFCADFELRWEKLDGLFHMVYVGPDHPLPDFALADEMDLNQSDRRSNSYYLWGNRLPEEQAALHPQVEGKAVFLEMIVPRILHYPVSNPGTRQLKIHVQEYLDKDTGDLVYYRFTGLEEVR